MNTYDDYKMGFYGWVFGILFILILFYILPYHIWERLDFSSLWQKIEPIGGQYDLGYFFPLLLFNTGFLLLINVAQTLSSSKHIILGAFWSMVLVTGTMLLVHTQINGAIYQHIQNTKEERFLDNQHEELYVTIERLEKRIKELESRYIVND